MSRTARELAEEDEIEDLPTVVEPVIDDGPKTNVPYNPKGLPLGWDGKV